MEGYEALDRRWNDEQRRLRGPGVSDRRTELPSSTRGGTLEYELGDDVRSRVVVSTRRVRNEIVALGFLCANDDGLIFKSTVSFVSIQRHDTAKAKRAAAPRHGSMGKIGCEKLKVRTATSVGRGTSKEIRW
jgi:hypothetical protein